jgi:hypothetical protein
MLVPFINMALIYVYTTTLLSLYMAGVLFLFCGYSTSAHRDDRLKRPLPACLSAVIPSIPPLQFSPSDIKTPVLDVGLLYGTYTFATRLAPSCPDSTPPNPKMYHSC